MMEIIKHHNEARNDNSHEENESTDEQLGNFGIFESYITIFVISLIVILHLICTSAMGHAKLFGIKKILNGIWNVNTSLLFNKIFLKNLIFSVSSNTRKLKLKDSGKEADLYTLTSKFLCYSKYLNERISKIRHTFQECWDKEKHNNPVNLKKSIMPPCYRAEMIQSIEELKELFYHLTKAYDEMFQFGKEVLKLTASVKASDKKEAENFVSFE